MSRLREWLRRRASVLIVLLVVGVLGGGALVAEGAQASRADSRAQRVQSQLDALKAQLAAQQRAQQRQGQVIEQKLCTTFGGLAGLQPPAGSPAGNPSRAYLQEEHARLAQVGPDIGCGGQHGR